MSAYRELRKLGAGGAGYVALAVDANGRHVAIKRPHAHLFDDAGALAAFRREIAVVSRLRHENVVTLYEADAAATTTAGDAPPELILEYVDGLTLGDLSKVWRKEQRSEPGAALSVVRDVARGLAAVHELRGATDEPLGLVHRDVSPQNILVGRDGIAKLTDFGLARSLARGDRSTTGGVLKGKAGYLAPEYIRGAPIDARVDIFALGIVMWEALVGERLFAEDNEAVTLQKILTTAPAPLSARGVDLGGAHADVQRILERATSRSPSARYASAREMADDLDRAIASHALPADRARVASSFGAATSALLHARAATDATTDRIQRSSTSRRRAAWALVIVGAPALIVAASRMNHRAEAPAGAPIASVPEAPATLVSLDAQDGHDASAAPPAPAVPLAPAATPAPSVAPLPSHRAHDPKAPRRNPY